MTYPIEIKKWLELPVSNEVRTQIFDQKVDDVLAELHLEINDENRFRVKAELINAFIRTNNLDKNEDDRMLAMLGIEKLPGEMVKVL